MTIKEIKENFKAAYLMIMDAESDYINWLKDQSIPLDERWKVFLDLQKGNISDRTDFDLDRDDCFLYDGPLHMEKYQVRDVADILEALIDDEKFKITPEEIVIFKEYCLDNYCIQMKFYW